MTVHGPYALAEAASLPWKNGRGTTRTLATSPAGASLEDFAWRISLAQIDADAEFSPFPGVDRTILLWSGNGVLLHEATGLQQALTRRYEPFAFSGEDRINAELVDGPTVDLNLMLRRGIAKGHLQHYETEHQLDGDYDDLVVLCAAGSIKIVRDGFESLLLQADQYMHLHAVSGLLHLVPTAPQTGYIVASLFVAEGESALSR